MKPALADALARRGRTWGERNTTVLRGMRAEIGRRQRRRDTDAVRPIGWTSRVPIRAGDGCWSGAYRRVIPAAP